MKTRGVDSIYSWIVAASCGFLYVMITSPLRLGSIIFVEMNYRYDTNRKDASLPFAVAYFMRSVSSPFAGYFGDRFGLQQVTMFGCVLCSVGVGLCFLSEEIISIDIFLGLIYGCGFGWSSCLGPEIINQHFLKHRVKGFSFCLGINGALNFLTPPLLKMVLTKYGVSGTFLIMSAIILNGVPAVMIMVKPDEKIPIQLKSSSLQTKNERSPSKTNIQAFTIQVAAPIEPVLSESSHLSKTKNLESKNICDDEDVNYNRIENTELKEVNLDLVAGRTMKASEVFNLELIESSDNKSLNIINSDSFEKKDNKSTESKFESIDILWSPLFLLITFIQSSYYYIMYLSWTIIVDVVRDKSIAHYLEVYFIMAMALFDTVGRSALGFVIDGGYMKIANYAALCFGVTGFSCMLLVWASGFQMTMAAICIFGLMNGANITVLPGIVTEFIEKEKRTMAMASRLILCAPMSFTMSPLIGINQCSL